MIEHLAEMKVNPFRYTTQNLLDGSSLEFLSTKHFSLHQANFGIIYQTMEIRLENFECLDSIKWPREEQNQCLRASLDDLQTY